MSIIGFGISTNSGTDHAPRGSVVNEYDMKVGGETSISTPDTLLPLLLLPRLLLSIFLHAFEVLPSVQTVHSGAFPVGICEKYATYCPDGANTTSTSCDHIGNCTSSRT